MHELSLCNSIRGIVTRAAGDRRVETVHVRVGQLRQVIPDTLAYCWGLVTEGTDLAGSRLAIDSVPVSLACRACSATTTVEHSLVLVCGSCRSGDIRIVTGEEFMITSLDLAPRDRSSPLPQET